MITQEELKTLLSYAEDTGIFRWLPSVNHKNANSIAGTVSKRGYIHIQVNKKVYKAHRLAWLYCYGAFPIDIIDHVNGIKTDNRLSNLRCISQRENSQNTEKHRKGHLLGTTWHKKRKRWQSQIMINGQRKYLGFFLTEEEAHHAYLLALSNSKSI